MKRINPMAIFFNLILAVLFGTGLSFGAEQIGASIDPTVPAAVLFGGNLVKEVFLPNVQGAMFMALQVEVWQRDIAENLFPDNTFMARSVDDTSFVIDGKTVHLPQSGGNPNVVKNRSSLPASVSKRTDDEQTYDLDSWTTDPIVVQNTENVEVSYDKRMSVLQQHLDTLNTNVADEMAYLWTPGGADNIVRSTGSSRNAYRGTGTRKAVTKNDLIELRRLLTRMDVPDDGNRIMLIPADLEADLLKISEFMDANKYGASNIPNGAIARVFGFNFYIRSRTTIFDNQATPVKKAVDAAEAGDDNLSILAWHPNNVRRAKGGITVFQEEQSPIYYGDIMSAEVRAGGKYARKDKKGVVSLVEDDTV